MTHTQLATEQRCQTVLTKCTGFFRLKCTVRVYHCNQEAVFAFFFINATGWTNSDLNHGMGESALTLVPDTVPVQFSSSPSTAIYPVSEEATIDANRGTQGLCKLSSRPAYTHLACHWKLIPTEDGALFGYHIGPAQGFQPSWTVWQVPCLLIW